MSKANIFLSIVLLFLVGILVFKYISDKKVDNRDSNGSPVITNPNDPPISGSGEEEDGLRLEPEYKGNNQWEYVVKGYLPTPCHGLELDVIIRESFPEQVEVVATITRPTEDVCIQVLTPVEQEGSFQASEGAAVNLSVVQED